MYKILNQVDNTEILLYSLIYEGCTANQLIDQMKNINSPITLRINSDGGEIFEGISLYNYLKDKDVTVIIDGICASSASIIAMAGRKIIMKTGSMMMIHNPSSMLYGDSEDFKAVAEVLDKMTDNIADIYSQRTGQDKNTILDLMKKNTWLNASEAKSMNFCDEIDIPDEEPKTENQENLIENKLTYEQGIMAERERLKALDELMSEGREKIINEAKYISGKTAQDIAITLLKSEKTLHNQPKINNFAVNNEAQDIQDFVDTISKLRR